MSVVRLTVNLVRMAREIMGDKMHLGDCSEERPCLACAKVAASLEVVRLQAERQAAGGRGASVCRACQIQEQGFPPSGSAVPVFLSGWADVLDTKGVVNDLCPEHAEDLARHRRIAKAIAKIRSMVGAS